MNIDIINSILIVVAGGFISVSVFKLYRDKVVRGVSPIHVGFFTLYGFWHIYFFSALDQWYSVMGGIVATSMNTLWFYMLIYYTIWPRGNVPRNPY